MNGDLIGIILFIYKEISTFFIVRGLLFLCASRVLHCNTKDYYLDSNCQLQNNEIVPVNKISERTFMYGTCMI